MKKRVRASLAVLLAGSMTVGGLSSASGPQEQPPAFVRIATVANYLNNLPDDFGATTVSEIAGATRDGMTLIYTDADRREIGFLDIRDPANPMPTGKLGVGGEPTSVDTVGNALALVAVNDTAGNFLAPRGRLLVIEIATRSILRSIDLGGQPDSIKVSPDSRYVAIAIENERNESVSAGGVAGGLPQLPAGDLVIVDILGRAPAAWTLRRVALTGLAAYAPDDPEPEFVDVNARNEAVVTLQENNHIAIVDLRSGKIVRHFPAGAVDLNGIDTLRDGRIALTDSRAGVVREPDAVAWLPGPLGNAGFLATANEGDLFGGSRGFTVFSRFGDVVSDSGSELERIAVRHGHYPDRRSNSKGTEPESVEYGRFRGRDYLFVASERGGFVAVYELKLGFFPRFVQLLPAPLSPEGVLAIPSRNLLVVSGEVDTPPFGVRSTISIYRFAPRRQTYPQIVSEDDAAGNPIGWSALSGLVALPGGKPQMLAVWDSAYTESRIFRIDASRSPARIVSSQLVTGGSGGYDPEGIALAPDGTTWIASEGNATDSRPNRLLQLDASGAVLREVGLPAAILACRRATTRRGTLGAGFEGLAVEADGSGRYRIFVAQQRGWDYTTPECEALDDDDGGLNASGEPNRTRIWTFDPVSGAWGHLAWELAPKPVDAAWVGLSEITRAPDGRYVLIERDNLTGSFAELKTLVRADLAAELAGGDRLVSAAEKRVVNFQPVLEATRGWITDKPEGVAILDDGRTFVVTDNDGVDGWSGETWFFELRPFRKLFR